MSEQLTNDEKKKKLSELIFAKKNEGKLIYYCIDSIVEADLKSICFDQPVDGLLWDLNRDIVTCLSLVEKSDDIVWINNTASGIVIEYLRNQYDALQHRLDIAVKALVSVSNYDNRQNNPDGTVTIYLPSIEGYHLMINDIHNTARQALREIVQDNAQNMSIIEHNPASLAGETSTDGKEGEG